MKLCQNCIRWNEFIKAILDEEELPEGCEGCYPIDYPLDENFDIKNNYEEGVLDGKVF